MTRIRYHSLVVCALVAALAGAVMGAQQPADAVTLCNNMIACDTHDCDIISACRQHLSPRQVGPDCSVDYIFEPHHQGSSCGVLWARVPSLYSCLVPIGPCGGISVSGCV